MVVEESQDKRLKKNNINIKIKFQDGDSIKERNTDDSKNDNINSGIIIEKDYYKDGILSKKENVFDSRILYTYVFEGQEEITCKNCGMKEKIEKFENGCPYCGSNYNIEYNSKELGSKNTYDYTVKDRKYVTKVLIKDIIISLIIMAIYIVNTSRTLYFFDILKIVVGTIIMGVILFFIFYYMDAKIILPSIKEKKEKLNNNQINFWNKMESMNIDKVKFYNNLIYSIRQLYYSDKYDNIIDFDILDYDDFKDSYDDNNMYIETTLDMRIVRIVNGKIESKREQQKFKLKRLKDFQELKAGTNLIKCPNCGSTINVNDNECSYCKTKINYLQEWYLEQK